jgi:hypothetical protein
LNTFEFSQRKEARNNFFFFFLKRRRRRRGGGGGKNRAFDFWSGLIGAMMDDR